ncbi:MAG: hypothetical protein OXG19_02715 [Chloroflexi bacterium]|nr:hypothetical protein [Chloroflexota bacterium]
MSRGLGDGASQRDFQRGGAWERLRPRRAVARWAAALAGMALLIAAALAGPAALFAQEDGGETEAAGSVTVILHPVGDFYVLPASAAPTTASALFGDVELSSLWKHRTGRDWIAYDPATGAEDFSIAGGDLLWIVVPRLQEIIVPLTESPVPPIHSITLTLRAGGGFYRVPEGSPTTAALLFGGTDVTVVWGYNSVSRAWDRSYDPVQNQGNFVIEADDLLWIEAPRAQTVGG